MSIISRSSRSTGNTYPSITSITFENLFHINLNSFASSFSKYRKVPHRVYSTTATMSVLLLCVLVTLLITAVFASSPLSVTASVRGKKFEVSAETVEEFTEKVEAMAGLEAGQNSVLFRGKVLSPSDKLEEVGISSGDVLMVVKGKKQRAAMPVQDNNGSGIQGRVPRQAAGGGMGGMGGMGFPGGMPSMDSMSPEDVQQAMKAMDKLLDSEFVEEYFADEERLEVARQNMLKNLDQYEEMMPGFKEQASHVVSDPEKWKDAMLKAKEQIMKLKKERDQRRASGGDAGVADRQAKSAPEDSVDDLDEEEN